MDLLNNGVSYLAVVLCLVIAGVLFVKRSEQPAALQMYYLVISVASAAFAGAKAVEIAMGVYFWERWWLLAWTVASVGAAGWAFWQKRRKGHE